MCWARELTCQSAIEVFYYGSFFHAHYAHVQAQIVFRNNNSSPITLIIKHTSDITIWVCTLAAGHCTNNRPLIPPTPNCTGVGLYETLSR